MPNEACSSAPIQRAHVLSLSLRPFSLRHCCHRHVTIANELAFLFYLSDKVFLELMGNVYRCESMFSIGVEAERCTVFDHIEGTLATACNMPSIFLASCLRAPPCYHARRACNAQLKDVVIFLAVCDAKLTVKLVTFALDEAAGLQHCQ